MFHIKWRTTQKMFSMCSVLFVEKISIGTLGNKSMTTIDLQIKIYTLP